MFDVLQEMISQDRAILGEPVTEMCLEVNDHERQNLTCTDSWRVFFKWFEMGSENSVYDSHWKLKMKLA